MTDRALQGPLQEIDGMKSPQPVTTTGLFPVAEFSRATYDEALELAAELRADGKYDEIRIDPKEDRAGRYWLVSGYEEL